MKKSLLMFLIGWAILFVGLLLSKNDTQAAATVVMHAIWLVGALVMREIEFRG